MHVQKFKTDEHQLITAHIIVFKVHFSKDLKFPLLTLMYEAGKC